MDDRAWADYLARFHGASPGITERLLALADADPHTWLVEPLRGRGGAVVDLGCGSAPTRDRLPEQRWVGLDSSPEELAYAAALNRGPLVMADATALPFRDGSVDAVCAAMTLQVLRPMETALGEIERILAPRGLLVALTPARPGPSPRGLMAWGRVLAALRTHHLPWPEPRACDGTAALLRARGWTVLSRQRRVLGLRMDQPEHTSLLVRGLYLPHVDDRRIRGAERSLTQWAAPGRTLPLPLARVVARPPGKGRQGTRVSDR
ncbi:class I SAM-dependent methyltransferase [Nocardiopsis sp. EMB25]|uniref:class I SAM-dependent methyltransferase n=1 Tax=Nocardiopsis sp. EMB25 TaxID=2835867 RepID=UPI0022837D27|nr:class I SAM-dependent methyltransferase [Nocardiopsis sp. EMB25]MCY9785243.1 class I SAM-dependent methyltransferase [Nocardiopsis sp. EMB25]